MDSDIRPEAEHLSFSFCLFIFFLRKISLDVRDLFPGIVNSQQSIIYLATLYINSALHSLSNFTEACFWNGEGNLKCCSLLLSFYIWDIWGPDSFSQFLKQGFHVVLNWALWGYESKRHDPVFKKLTVLVWRGSNTSNYI